MPQFNPRKQCLIALAKWNQRRKFADDIMRDLFAKGLFNPRDKAFFQECFYGILRNKALLDFWVNLLRSKQIDEQTRNVLRLGLYQIFFTRVPDHAAVCETVEIAGRGKALANAVLRHALREKDALLQQANQADKSICFSHPKFLIKRWREQYSAEAADALCQWNNLPAEVFIRPNLLKISGIQDFANEGELEPCPANPLLYKALTLRQEWLAAGLCYVQDPSTSISCDLLSPTAAETVLDACAAPGGKAAYLAQLMQNRGRLVACDALPDRVILLRENLLRLGLEAVEIHQVDWRKNDAPFQPESFDAILLDAPCSNTGTMRRRIDVRWRIAPEDFAKTQALQLELADRLIPLLKKSGRFVYSTCSLEREENEQVVEKLLKRHSHLSLAETRQTLPFREQTDGAFAALLRRTGD